ncbi:helix-turn-helix transcriptional regulator [Staphylococcus equorum]|uniref:helix-turn-helix transcriptional regulator n=1 Tax=Staphylococcus equorum TaxID=246432 RepID=UPI002554C76C|nr:helix-turn-helix domain-containing protein [Staphylococcus equorum]MDK9853860.1 helix-turn-helix domain-containing protein [Staphylococcus equorum]
MQTEKLARHKLKKARGKKGEGQEKVAKVINKSVVSYCDKENGKKDFNLPEMQKLAKYFNKSLDELFWEDEELESDKGIV